MTPKVKQRLRDFGRRAGLEIRLSGPNSRDDLRLLHFLHLKEIDTVLDVGANNGGFAKMLLAAGFKGQIISFEPLPGAHTALTAAAKAVENWSVAPRLALSDENGTANFNITKGDTSSSLLEPSDSFVSDTPHVEVSEVIEVPTRRLDDLEGITFEPSRTLLKLDVQGGEAKVLGGGETSLQSMAGILTEMSLIPLYVGQPNWIAIDQIINRYGFEIWDVWPGYRSPNTRRLTQIDGLYFRWASS